MTACRHRWFTDEDSTRCLYCGRGQVAAVVATEELRRMMDTHRTMAVHEAVALLAKMQQEQEQCGVKLSEFPLRVWNIVNAPNPAFRVPVTSVEEAASIIARLILQQLDEDWIGMNVFGLETFEDGEWVEWYDDEGNDIDFYVDQVLYQEEAGDDTD